MYFSIRLFGTSPEINLSGGSPYQVSIPPDHAGAGLLPGKRHVWSAWSSVTIGRQFELLGRYWIIGAWQ